MELGLSRLPAAVTNGALQRTGKPSICRGQGDSLCILVLAAGAGNRVKPMGEALELRQTWPLSQGQLPNHLGDGGGRA